MWLFWVDTFNSNYRKCTISRYKSLSRDEITHILIFCPYHTALCGHGGWSCDFVYVRATPSHQSKSTATSGSIQKCADSIGVTLCSNPGRIPMCGPVPHVIASLSTPFPQFPVHQGTKDIWLSKYIWYIYSLKRLMFVAATRLTINRSRQWRLPRPMGLEAWSLGGGEALSQDFWRGLKEEQALWHLEHSRATKKVYNQSNESKM